MRRVLTCPPSATTSRPKHTQLLNTICECVCDFFLGRMRTPRLYKVQPFLEDVVRVCVFVISQHAQAVFNVGPASRHRTTADERSPPLSTHTHTQTLMIHLISRSPERLLLSVGRRLDAHSRTPRAPMFNGIHIQSSRLCVAAFKVRRLVGPRARMRICCCCSCLCFGVVVACARLVALYNRPKMASRFAQHSGRPADTDTQIQHMRRSRSASPLSV